MSDWFPPNPDHPPPKRGEPPLHRAARIGDAVAIKSLLAGGAEIDARFEIGLDPDAYGRPATPLLVAAGSGDGATVQTVRLLLELGADPTITDGRSSAATFACTGLGWNYRPGGDADRLREVLQAGAPLPSCPKESSDLLGDAARSGDAERLAVLLEHGLPPNGHWDPEEARALQNRINEESAALRASEPDFFAGLPDGFRDAASMTFDALHAQLNEQHISAPSSFEIPLFRAAESGNPECVRLLIEAGADVDKRDNMRCTAMYHASSDGVVRALVEAGLPVEDSDAFGWSPLMNALSNGEDGVAMIRALLAHGADANGSHDRGYTVFMSAVGSMERSADALRALIDAGADPNAVSDLGYNAFHAAVDVSGEANEERSVRAILTLLRDLGVDLEHRNNSGQTPRARSTKGPAPKSAFFASSVPTPTRPTGCTSAAKAAANGSKCPCSSLRQRDPASTRMRRFPRYSPQARIRSYRMPRASRPRCASSGSCAPTRTTLMRR